MRRILAHAAGRTVAWIAWVLTAVRGNWTGTAPVRTTRIYFANHRSHGDFVLIWTVLPAHLRGTTRPVAAADYWLKTRFRRFIIQDVFRAVLIERDPGTRRIDPIQQMTGALDRGESLILFPEGTRNPSDDGLLPFKSGLYHLARARPEIELVPVWIDNIGRVMPKGELLPVPIGCSVTFGSALAQVPDEPKDAFLARAAEALKTTNPRSGDDDDIR